MPGVARPSKPARRGVLRRVWAGGRAGWWLAALAICCWCAIGIGGVELATALASPRAAGADSQDAATPAGATAPHQTAPAGRSLALLGDGAVASAAVSRDARIQRACLEILCGVIALGVLLALTLWQQRQTRDASDLQSGGAPRRIDARRPPGDRAASSNSDEP